MSEHSSCAVIGSSGMVGHALVRRLCDLGHEVYAVQRKLSPADDARATYIYGDVADETTSSQFLGKVETVFYAAAYKKNLQVHTTQPFQVYVQNELPFLQFLSAAASAPPTRIVFLGSIYAEHAPTIPTVGAFDGYSAAKCAEEYALEAFAKEYQTTCIFLRVAPIYGPGNDVDPRTANMIPSLLQRIHRTEGALEVWGNGQRRLQMVYIDDVVENALQALSQTTAGLHRIGHPEVVSIDDIVQMAIEASGKSLTIEHDLTKPDKATELYEFTNLIQPTVGLREGILQTHAWMRENNLYA